MMVYVKFLSQIAQETREEKNLKFSFSMLLLFLMSQANPDNGFYLDSGFNLTVVYPKVVLPVVFLTVLYILTVISSLSDSRTVVYILT